MLTRAVPMRNCRSRYEAAAAPNSPPLSPLPRRSGRVLTLRSHVETAHRQTGERSEVALAQLALFAQLPHGCAKRGEDPRVASAPENGGCRQRRELVPRPRARLADAALDRERPLLQRRARRRTRRQDREAALVGLTRRDPRRI